MSINEFAHTICYKIKTAVFEVREDIKDPLQYVLLDGEETIADMYRYVCTYVCILTYEIC